MSAINQGFQISKPGIISCQGVDAKTFLQGQLSADLNALADNELTLACYCNLKGRILSTSWLMPFQKGYVLFLPEGLIQGTLADLKKYGAFSKVDITVLEDWQAYAVTLTPGHDYANLASKRVQNHNNGLIARLPGSQSDCLLSLGPHASLDDFDIDLENVDHDCLDVWYIQNNIAMIKPESFETFTPHEVSLQKVSGAISFNKGCYKGQEIVARMHYRAKLKQGLHQASVQTTLPLLPARTLYDATGKSTGHIVLAHRMEDDNWLLSITIKDDALENGVFIDEAQSQSVMVW